MTTTVVRDSIVGDNWLYQTAQAVPIQRVYNDAGQFTGDILTGPVRLSWPYLFELPPATPDNENPKYGAVLMYTPYADFTIMYEEYYEECGRSFPEYYDQRSGAYSGLHSPFRDQSEKAAKFQGYTPGAVFMNCSSQFKPPVVDSRYNPIVDPAKVYPGVWAICSIKAFPFGKQKGAKNRGVSFGLQTVMIIGDDTNLGGGAADPKATFKGVQVAAPITRPDPSRLAGPAGAPGGAPGMPPRPIPQQRMAPPPNAGGDDDMSFMN